MKFYKISEEVRNALIAYLLTRPMQEIEMGVQALRNLEEIDPLKEDE